MELFPSRDENISEDNTKRVPKFAFHSAATLSSCAQALDAISSIDFSPDSSIFATGGVAKKIRIYRLTEDNEFEEPNPVEAKKGKRNVGSGLRKMEELYVPAKLSSVAWHPFNSTIICSGDYDGVVTEWDVQNGVAINERYDHGGQRVWSVDYSRGEHRCASSSSDGTVRLWSTESENSNLVLRPSAAATGGISMCSAKFSPLAPNLLAAASADGNFYLFDIRKPEGCVWSVRGHSRAISYVRFLDEGRRLVSASIDNSLKVWDISVNEPGLIRSWEGEHVNVKNFVGLSAVDKCGGLIACGSETNELFVYHSEHDRSLWRTKFPSVCESGVFVGAACWTQNEDSHGLVSVVAANSEGYLQLIHGSIVF